MKITDPQTIKEYKKWLFAAAEASKKAVCLKRPRGAVIVLNGRIIGKGANAPADQHVCVKCLRDQMKPRVFGEFNTEPCYAVHAEQRAIIDAFKNGYRELSNAKMFFARTENGIYFSVDDGPSCTICSKLILESGLQSFIYETVKDGILELPAKEFNDLSLQYVENCIN